MKRRRCGEFLVFVLLMQSALSSHAFFFESSAPIATNSQEAVIADMNGDGLPDILSMDIYTNRVSLFTNVGPGRFVLATSIVPLTNTMVQFAVGDMNNDGRFDLVSTHFGVNPNNIVAVTTNDGSGGFALASSISLWRAGTVSPADVNGDGRMDVVYLMLSTGFGAATNIGAGHLAFASSNMLMYYPINMTTGDFNRDGRPDVVTMVDEGPGVVSTNDGTGRFITSQITASSEVVVAADVNGDQALDLIMRYFAYTNNGSGQFSFAVGFANVQSLVAVDVNADGRSDWIASHYTTNRFSVFTNDGGGGVVLADRPIAPTAPSFVATGDLNGDGRVDIVSVNNRILSVLWNQPAPVLVATRPFTNSVLMVSWPFAAPEWRLETTTNLSAANEWTEVPPPYVTNGLRLRHLKIFPRSPSFYRLRNSGP